MKRPSRRRLVLALLAVLVLALVVPAFVNLNHYRDRIARTLGGAFGREVTVGAVGMRLLPQPAFVLYDVVVADDPGFSAEPMLRASEVTAALRLTSLWRGRLEIARLSLKEPSLNLVRRADGEWNVTAVLARAQQAPAAPTAHLRPEQRPRFPYVEVDTGRINLKLGVEKKVFALTDADFALWLATEDEWRVRLDARPIRTDSDLSDTGRIVAEGWLERRAPVADSALHLRLRWRDAQLGALTALLYGRDRGWRGSTTLLLEANGTARELALQADATVAQFRRYDITPRAALDLGAHCTALLLPAERSLRGIDCHLPAGAGVLAAAGAIEHIAGGVRYDLKFRANNIPAGYAVAFAQRAKKDMPEDLAAAGNLTGELALRTAPDGSLQWSGSGATTPVRLSASVLSQPLVLGAARFDVSPPPAAPQPRRGRRVVAAPATPQPFRLVIAPFAVPLGAPRVAQARAEFTRQGYEIDLTGAADLPRLLEVARVLGVRAPAGIAQGSARVDLALTGGWAGFTPPLTTGTAEVSGVTAAIPGIAAPVKIAAARLTLAPTEIAVQNLVVAAGSIVLSGSLARPRGCPPGPNCVVQFSLASERVALDDLNRLLNPRLRSTPWYRRIAGGETAGSVLAGTFARGRVTVAKVLIKGVPAQNVSAAMELAPGIVALHEVDAGVFGGKLQGTWRAEFGGAAPTYAGSGTVQRAQMALVAAAMGDNWAAGTLDANWRLALSGGDARELGRSAAGSLDFDWRDGTLRHLTFEPASVRAAARTPLAPLRLQRFTGRATLRSGTVALDESRMETPEGVYLVSGTASNTRALALRFTARARSYDVGGTLEAPRVEARVVPEPRAAVTR